MQSLPSLWLITFVFAVGKVESRLLSLSSSDTFISTGVVRVENQATYVKCEHIYGFFPCAENVGGFIFLIAIYQFLMIVGEKLVSDGSKTMFNILGTGIFGATLFQILKAFPSTILVIASGVFCSKEKAHTQVYSGVSINVGATVFNLTLMWGICVIFGAKETDETSTSRPAESSVSKYLQVLRNKGVTIDRETNRTAGIMLLSLIPFALVELVSAFIAYFRRRIVIITGLVVSVTLLLSYFIYQLWDPWIQERSLEYTKYENLLAAFLNHMQRHASGKLIDEQGRPDIQAIKRLFFEADKDANENISLDELEKLITDMQSGKFKVDKDYAISKLVKAFDLNNDKKIDQDEFTEGCKRLIEEAKMLAKSDDSTTSRNLHEVVQHDRNKEPAQLIAKILKHVQSQALGAEHILNDDGNPNIECIKEIFHQHDSDGNNFIARSELKKLIASVNYGVQINSDDLVAKVLKDFDKDGNDMIDIHEFVHGITRWLEEVIRVANCKDKKKAIDEYDKIMWREVDELVYENDGRSKHKMLTWDFNKSLFQVILGIGMLAFCSKPLNGNSSNLSS